MGFCTHCEDYCPTIKDPDNGYVCCANCGKILEQDVYYSGPTFAKDSCGQSRLAGSIMHSVQSGYSASHERTLMKGRDEISLIVDSLRIGGGDSIINKAHAFYQIAVDKNFTKGRRIPQVAAACLYIACRQTKKAYLLIDFSDFLKINVYVLGAVFLQLCKTLRLSEHPIVQKLVDPCLFIHRFTERLLGRKNNAVSETALRIVASMKRDWMQTGRKPSGLCGAALYISALSHGLSYSKSDVVSVVYVCETTLTKRLIEFENTESGSLTIEEFLARADELDAESESNQLPKPGEVLCKHKDGTTPHFAHGLCKKCYDKFVKISGGLHGGAEPPAFQRAERQRREKAKQQEKARESNPVDKQYVVEGLGSVHNKEKSCASMTTDIGQSEGKTLKEPESAGNESVDPSSCSEQENLGETSDNESDNFSDIDDSEVDGYLHDEKEKEFKRIIWEEMNKEYLEEQAAKEAVAAAAKASYEANFANGSEDVLAAKELAEATAAALAKWRKEKNQKRAEEAKNEPPPRTPLEATRQMLKRKAFSSKVNYEALEALYTSEQETEKKQRAESETLDSSELPTIPENDAVDPGDEGDMEDADELGTFDDNNFDEVGHDDYMGHGDEDYGYDDDFGFS